MRDNFSRLAQIEGEAKATSRAKILRRANVAWPTRGLARKENL